LIRLLMALCLMATPLAAATTETFGGATVSNSFDASPGSARSMALGGAFVALADDSSAVDWNPAGLALLTDQEVSLHHQSWLDGVIQEKAFYATPWPGYGAMGYGLTYVNWGDFEQRDFTGALTGSFNDNALGASVAWGKEWMPGLSLGLGLDGLQENLGGASSVLVGGQAGVLWFPNPLLTAGLAFSEGGGQESTATYPWTLKTGVALHLGDGPSRVALAGGINVAAGSLALVPVGVEWTFQGLLALRAGYQQSLASRQIDGLQGLTAGAGFSFKNFTLDYGVQFFGELGSSQRASLAYHFGRQELEKEGGAAQIQAATEPRPAPAPSGKELDLSEKNLAAVIAAKNALSGQASLQNWLALAWAYSDMGNATGAERACDRALDKDPEDAEARKLLKASREAQAGRDAKAVSERARGKARAYVVAKEYPQAIESYGIAIQWDPQNDLAWQGLGNAYYLTDNRDRAIHAFEKALELNPSNETLRKRLKKYREG
jgi:hypothetical protein